MAERQSPDVEAGPVAPPEAGRRADPENRGETPHRSGVVIVWAAASAMALVLLAIEPWAGAVLSVACWVAVVPWGGRPASDRLVAFAVMACGLLAAALAVGDELEVAVLTLDRVRFALAVPALVALASTLIAVARRRRHRVADLDLALVPLLMTAVAAWAATGLTARGVDLGQGVGGLMALGWDHQSHFSIFSFLYEQHGVWRAGPPASASMFLGYPPLSGAIGVALVLLVAPPGMDPVQQFPYYVQATAVVFALGAGLLAWTGASIGRTIAQFHGRSSRAGAIGLTAGVVTGGYVVLGPAAAMYDYGFVNFFLAVSIATATTWLALGAQASVGSKASLGQSALVVAAAVAMAQLWTPLVVLMVPAGLVLVARTIRARQWAALAGTALLAAGGGLVAAWQVLRIAPSGGEASSLASTIAGAGGGQAAVPVPHLLAFCILVFAVVVLSLPGRPRHAWVPFAVPAAGFLIVAVFVYNTVRAGLSVEDSYYVAKSLWVAYLALTVMVATATSFGALALLSLSDKRGTSRGDLGQIGLTGILAAAVFWASSPTANAPNGFIDYYATPVGGEAVRTRWTAFREVPQGSVVSSAEQATRRWPRRLAIAWDSGDLLTNRWLGSLRGDLSSQNNNVYQSLGGAPYAQPAVDAVRAALSADEDLSVVLVVATDESKALLKPLVDEFPRRVSVQMY